MKRTSLAVLMLALALVALAAPMAFAQAPAPKVTINGLIDNVTSYSQNVANYNGGFFNRKDSMWYFRTRGRFDIIGEVGKAKGVLGLEMDHVFGQAGSNDSTIVNAGAASGTAVQTGFGTDGSFDLNTDSRGIIEVKKGPLDLTAIVKAAIETSRPVLDNLRHEIRIDFEPSQIIVGGDPVRLTQVFANLLNNAAKYTNHNGVIKVTTRRENGEAVVSVKDNGIGITPNALSQVFDMFMQVDRSTRRSQGGLGIGLTLVRSLVGMHGGSVEARSEGPGLGSEFIVRLPLLTEAALPSETSRRIQPLPSRRILIVDDSRDGGESLAMLLRVLGAEVSLAHSGRAALDCMNSFRPDVVLLDIGMPGMDGYEVARRIRANPNNRHISLIALTGWGQDDDRQRSTAAGFNHHLVKPADIDQLRQLLTVA